MTYTSSELIARVEKATGYRVLRIEREERLAAYRVLLSSNNVARLYPDGYMCYLSGGGEDMTIRPREDLRQEEYRQEFQVVHYRFFDPFPDTAYNPGMQYHDGTSRVRNTTFDLHDVRKSQDTKEDFWAMVRKLQYHRSASNGSVV